MSDPTAEQLARESGEAIANTLADALEGPLLKMADAIATLQREQAELRDELHSLEQLTHSVARVVEDRTAHLA